MHGGGQKAMYNLRMSILNECRDLFGEKVRILTVQSHAAAEGGRPQQPLHALPLHATPWPSCFKYAQCKLLRTLSSPRAADHLLSPLNAFLVKDLAPDASRASRATPNPASHASSHAYVEISVRPSPWSKSLLRYNTTSCSQFIHLTAPTHECTSWLFCHCCVCKQPVVKNKDRHNDCPPQVRLHRHGGY